MENIENWKIRCNFQASAINPCELNPIINLFLFTFSSLSLSLSLFSRFSFVDFLHFFGISSRFAGKLTWRLENTKCQMPRQRDEITRYFFVYHFSLFLNFSLLSHIIAIFTHKKRTRRVFLNDLTLSSLLALLNEMRKSLLAFPIFHNSKLFFECLV